VFVCWSYERLSGCDGSLLAAVGLMPFLYLPNILIFTISISKLAFALAFNWLYALASCTGSELSLLRWLGSPLDAI